MSADCNEDLDPGRARESDEICKCRVYGRPRGGGSLLALVSLARSPATKASPSSLRNSLMVRASFLEDCLVLVYFLSMFTAF